MKLSELSCSAFILSQSGDITSTNRAFASLSLCTKDYRSLHKAAVRMTSDTLSSLALKLEIGQVFLCHIATLDEGCVLSVQPLFDTHSAPFDSRYENITSAVDELSDGLVIINKQGNVEFLNRQFYSVFPSLAHQDFVGMSVLDVGKAIVRSGDIILLDSPQTVIKWLTLNIYNQRPINWEFKTLSGGYYRYRDKLAQDGERIGLLTDESSYYQLNEQFELSFKQALELSEAKSQFMAMMGHEIRTPLNVIIGLIDLCLAHPDPSNTHNLKLTQKNAHYLLDLLNNVLDYTKFEENKVSLSLHQCDVRALCEGIVESFAQQHAASQSWLSLYVDPAIRSAVICDDMRLAQVLNNLIANAVKFNQSMDKWVSMRVQLDSEDQLGAHCRLKFSVRDNGIGMTPEEQQRIFNGFMQASHDTHRKYGGTGLGLSICQRICQLMGTRLEVQSAPGQGSEFWFCINVRVDRSQACTEIARLVSPVCLITNHERVYENLKDYSHGIGFRCVYLPLIQMDKLEEENAYFLIDPDEDTELSWSHIEDIIGQLCGPYAFLSASGRVQNKAYWFSSCPIKPSKIVNWINGQSQFDDDLMYRIHSDQSFSNLHVLVVDDNPDNLFVLQQQFAVLGVAAKFCMRPDEAIDRFKQDRFNVVISDYQMPDINGAALIKNLREIEKDKGLTPISMIILSADKSGQCQRECLCSGVTDIHVKPLPFKSLEQLLLQQVKLNENKGLGRDKLAAKNADRSHSTLTQAKLVDADAIFDFVGPIAREQLVAFWKQTISNLKANKVELLQSKNGLNFQKMKDIAHKIKSSAMYFGGHRLCSTCITLENSVVNDPDNISQILSNCSKTIESLDETIDYLTQNVL